MRCAILSDLHGNLTALEAVLSDLDSLDVDQMVCLGDVAAFGPWPRETLGRLKELACPTVMGNTDAWLLDPRPHPIRSEDSTRITDIEMWAAEQLTAKEVDYLKSFKPTLTIQLEGDARLLCFHGSPNSNTEIILATTPDDELEEMLSAHRAEVMAGGHTHTQLLRRHMNSWFVNPGSVGLPYERPPSSDAVRNPPWAEYAVLEQSNQSLAVTFRRVNYDISPVIKAAKESGMPHVDWWIKDWG